MKKFLKVLATSVALGVFITLACLLPKLSASADSNDVEEVWSIPESTTDPIIKAYDLKATSDNGFVVAGQGWFNYTPGVAPVGYYASLFKYDVDGNLEWHAKGGGPYSFYTSVLQLSADEYIAVGYGNAEFNNPDRVGKVSKFHVDGDTVTETEYWEFVHNSTEDSSHTTLTGILLDSDNNYVISGLSGEQNNVFVAKLKSSHDCSVNAKTICTEDLAWLISYDNANTNNDMLNYTNKIIKTGDGEFVFTTGDNGYLKKIKESTAGDSVSEIWSEDTINAWHASSTLDKEFFITTNNINNRNFRESYTEKTIDGTTTIVPSGLAPYTSATNYYNIATRTIPTIDNEYLALGGQVSSGYSISSYLFKIDSNGKILWQIASGETGYDNYWIAGDSYGDGTYVVISDNNVIKKYKDKTEYQWLRYNIVSDADPNLVKVNDSYWSLCNRDGRTSAKKGETFILESVYFDGCTLGDINFFEGFEFSGWYQDPEMTIELGDMDLTANRNIDIYGSYEKLEYDIPFLVMTDEDDGTQPTVVENSVQTVSAWDTVDLPEIEIPEGYKFDGWYIGTIVDGERVFSTNKKYTDDFTYSAANISKTSSEYFDFLWAKLTRKKTFEIPFYAVSYEEEGGTPTASLNSIQSGYVGDTVTLPSISTPYEYELKGWYAGTVVDGEPVYSTDRSFSGNFTYTDADVGQFDFIYVKFVKIPTYTIPYYAVVYDDSYTNIIDVVELYSQNLHINDYLNFPYIDSSRYNYTDSYWYGGTIVDGEKSYNGSPTFYDYRSYRYTQSSVGQYDFIYKRVTRKPVTVHFNMSDSYQYYNGNGDWITAHYCGDYSDEMTNYPDETVALGDTITTEIKTSSPDHSCVLGSLRLSPYSYESSYDTIDFTPDMPIDRSNNGSAYIIGNYIQNYLIVRNDKVYYATGEEYDVDSDETISWDPSSNILTLENYNGPKIEFDNGADPINLVINGENDTQIMSSTTPIVVSGEGSLGNKDHYTSPYYSIKATDAASLVIESGNITDGEIQADNMIVSGGTIDSRINICPSYRINYDESLSCQIVINGGEINGTIDAYKGDILIYDGTIKGGGVETDNGNLIIEGGKLSPDSDDFEAEKIIINGGEISGIINEIEAESFIMNGGKIDAIVTDGFVVENYFLLNDGEINITSFSPSTDQGTLVIEQGYAVFNGGKANFAGIIPSAITYPGTIDELISRGVAETDIADECANHLEDINALSAHHGYETFANEEDCNANLPDRLPSLYRAEMEETFGGPLPTHGAAIEINGGDVTFDTLEKEDLVEIVLDWYMAEFEEEIASEMPSTEEEVVQICTEEDMSEADIMFAAYKTWRIDIGNGTLVPMEDEDGNPVMLPEIDMSTMEIAVDEDGNPIFITLYNVVDGEGNIIYSKVGQGKDEEGNTFYFKAGFTDTNDCVENLLTVYLDLMLQYYRDYMRKDVEEDLGDIEPWPVSLMVSKVDETGENTAVDESAVYINENLFKDPKDMEVAVGDITIKYYNDDEPKTGQFVTFVDGEGTPSVTVEYKSYSRPIVTESENTLGYARIYEDAVITFKDYDDTIIFEKSDYHPGDRVMAPANPTRENSPAYKYTFAGWDKEVEPTATGDTVYTATYDAEPWDISFKWLENQTFEVGADDQSVLSIDVAKKFFAHIVKVDGEEIEEDVDYVATEGSTVITLQKDYLEPLAVGAHTIEVYFSEPTLDDPIIVTTKFFIRKKTPSVPNTGNESFIKIGYSVATASGAIVILVVAAIFIRRRKL